MNRSLLIVVCDFLLLSMMAIARFDQQPAASPPPAAAQAPARGTTAAADLVAAMKLTLEEERLAREELAASLEEEQETREQVRSALENTQEALREQRELTARREQEIQAARAELEAMEAEARRLEQARAELAGRYEQTQASLRDIQEQLSETEEEAQASRQRLQAVREEFSEAQEDLMRFQEQLSSTSAEARAARERYAQAQAELEARRREAEQARQRLAQVEEARVQAVIERERLAGDLKAAEAAQRFTRRQLLAVSNQVQTVQAEKERIQSVATELAEGVVEFAETQGELAEEIREFRPMTAHAIFSQFITNRVQADFRATRDGILGTVSRDTQPKTILVRDGEQTYAIFHVEDTPMELEANAEEWERVLLHLMRMYTTVALREIRFLAADPRIVVAPVSEADVRRLQATPYRLAKDPYRFQEALLIGADEGYYGEGQFRIDAENPSYMRMDRSRFARLVGEFNPSRGDLVFSKSGELLGMMVNNEYAALLGGLEPAGIIQLGMNPRTEETLERMHMYVEQLPDEMR